MKHNQEEARAILTALSNGDTVNGIQSPPFTIPKGKIKLLGTSYKVDKGRTAGIHTAILYLEPSDAAGITRNGKRLDVCPWATEGCKAGCLVDSGKMRITPAKNARLWRTALYHAAPDLMRRMIVGEVALLETRAAKAGELAAVRLDGTSDLGLAELWKMPELFPAVKWYDYTKSVSRIRKYNGRDNMHYTFSASEAADSRTGAKLALDKGLSVAAIVNQAPECEQSKIDLAAMVLGFHRYGTYLASHDDTDARFLDQPGTIGWLSVKGGRKVQQRLGKMVFSV